MLYLISLPVLQVVNQATSFQEARFLPLITAYDTWQTLREFWIDIYQGPSNIVIYNTGTNFAFQEFRSEARTLAISFKQIPVEVYWSIGKVERYYQPLKRAFDILYKELSGINSKEAILQMAVKAVNDTAGFNGLISTFLVFGAFSRISHDSSFSPLITKRAKAVNQAIKELRKHMAARQMNAALNIRNGPNPAAYSPMDLPLQSEVRVWRENGGWQGFFRVIAHDGQNVTLELPNGPAIFRFTMVVLYYRSFD
jgi:hypothetical protein